MNTLSQYHCRYALIFSLAIGLAFSSCKSSKKSPATKQAAPITRPMTDSGRDNDKNPIVIENKEDKTENLSSKRLRQLDRVLSTANSYLGTKHRMGGMSKKGIDCSGLVVVSYNSIDLSLPRSTSQQMGAGQSVKINDLQIGDLVFFTYPGGKKVTHVGIVKEVRSPQDIIFIHTSSSKGVRDDNVFSNYWRSNFLGARRVLR